MVYTQKHPALFLMGVSMVAIGTLAHFGLMDGLINYLAIKKMMGEITTLSYLFGSIAIVVGLWHWFGKHKEGHLDYYLSTVAGVIFILAIAMSVRWFLAPANQWGPSWVPNTCMRCLASITSYSAF